MYSRENRAMSLQISIHIEFYNSILPHHGFLVGLCADNAGLRSKVSEALATEIAK